MGIVGRVRGARGARGKAVTEWIVRCLLVATGFWGGVGASRGNGYFERFLYGY